MRGPGSARVAGALIAVAVLAVVAPAGAADAVRLEVERPVVVQGDPVEIRLVVPDDDAELVSMPIRPNVPIQATGTESSIQIMGGRSSSQTVLRYRFTAAQAGRYVIGPAVVRLDDRQLRSDVLEVRVAPPGAERALAVSAVVEPRAVWAGQPFRYRLLVAHGSQLSPESWAPPEAPDLAQLPGPERAAFRAGVTEVGGQHLATATLERWYVAPDVPAAGATIGLDGGELRLRLEEPRQRRRGIGMFDWPEDRGRRVAQANPPARVHVRPLPPPPAPTFTGIVGAMDVQWRPSGRDADRIRGVLRLRGRGWAPGLQLNTWVEDGWRLYPDEPQLAQVIDGQGQPRLDIVVPVVAVPAAEGAASGAPLWFDTRAGRYRALVLGLPRAPRHGAAAGAAPTPAPAATPATSVTATPSAGATGAWLGAAGTTLAALAALLAFAALAAEGLRRRRRGAARPLNGLAAARAARQALGRDDHGSWLDLYNRLHDARDAAAIELRRRLAGHLFGPAPTSPAADVRDWLGKVGETGEAGAARRGDR